MPDKHKTLNRNRSQPLLNTSVMTKQPRLCIASTLHAFMRDFLSLTKTQIRKRQCSRSADEKNELHKCLNCTQCKTIVLISAALRKGVSIETIRQVAGYNFYITSHLFSKVKTRGFSFSLMW